MKCLYCGKKEVYARDLCVNCYNTLKNIGELNYKKRKKRKNDIINKIHKLQLDLEHMEKGEEYLSNIRGDCATKYYVYLAKWFDGYNLTEIAKMYGISKQAVQQTLSGKTKLLYRKKKTERKAE